MSTRFLCLLIRFLTQDNLEVETFKKLFVGPDYTEFFDLLALLLKFQTYRFGWVGFSNGSYQNTLSIKLG